MADEKQKAAEAEAKAKAAADAAAKAEAEERAKAQAKAEAAKSPDTKVGNFVLKPNLRHIVVEDGIRRVVKQGEAVELTASQYKAFGDKFVKA